MGETEIPTPVDPDRQTAPVTQPEAGNLDKKLSQSASLAIELPPQYELIGRVSEGGMGAIFKARNVSTGALYAIKILHQEFNDNEEIHQRFFLEAKVASTLKHPNICQFHDFGITESGTAYLVMEWIDGINLQNKVMRDGPLSTSETVQIFQQAASALEHAHGKKLVHRDLKPDNIMLSRRRDGQTVVHVVDFGIAKLTPDEQTISRSKGLTQTGMIVGTPLYMSPEQARAFNVDQRSDIYSFGCVMYFALSGSPPFYGESVLDTMYQHVSKEVPQFDSQLRVPESLSMIVYKAMEKEPADRYQDILTLAGDLRNVNRGITVEHRPLAKERLNSRKRVVRLAYFVLGFLIMYAVSIALQNLLSALTASPQTETTKAKAASQKHGDKKPSKESQKKPARKN